MSGNPAHAFGGGIMDKAAQQAPVIYSQGRCDFRLPRCWRQKSSMLHSQRLENMRVSVFLQRHAGDALHQLTQHNEIDVTIDKLGAGWGLWLFRIGPAKGFL